MAPRYDKNDNTHFPVFGSLSLSDSSCGKSAMSLDSFCSTVKTHTLGLPLEQWGLHAVQIAFAAYAMLWKAETFLFVASFILSLYEVKQTHDAGRLTLYRNCVLWLLWGLKPGPMEWSRVAALLVISLTLAGINCWSKREEGKRTAKKKVRESLLLLAPDGVVIVEKDGKAVRCNAQALEMMKVGSEAELLTTLKTHTSEGSILSRATAGNPSLFYIARSSRSFEWRFITSSESTIIFIRDTAPLQSLQTSIAASTSFTHSLLTNFLQQLRSPANTIVNLLEEVSNSEGFAMRVCKSAARTLASVMSDLRDNEQMKSGVFELKKTKFELDKLLSECVDVIAPQARLKRVSFSQRYDCTIPKRIRSDPNRIRQVVLTLLNDAIKFNSSGYLELVAVSTRDNTVKVSIEDPDSRSKDPGEYIDIRLAVAKDISKRLSSNGLHIENSIAEGFKSSFEIDINRRNDSETDSEDVTDDSVSPENSEKRCIPMMISECRRKTKVTVAWDPYDATVDGSVHLSRKPTHPRRLGRHIRLSF